MTPEYRAECREDDLKCYDEMIAVIDKMFHLGRIHHPPFDKDNSCPSVADCTENEILATTGMLNTHLSDPMQIEGAKAQGLNTKAAMLEVIYNGEMFDFKTQLIKMMAIQRLIKEVEPVAV